MPTKKTILVYTFAELSDDAKDRARDWFREGSDSVTEDAANVGIKITGFDIGRGINGTVEDTEGTAHAIVKDHGEGCNTYKLAAQYLADRNEAIDSAPKDEDGETDESALDEKLDELGAEFTRAILEEYLCMLRNEYEYQTSDEAVDEDIEANGYLFTEDGERSATL